MLTLEDVRGVPLPGVFACGDVQQSPVKRVASAVGEEKHTRSPR
jgi:thioredoxin reductase